MPNIPEQAIISWATAPAENANVWSAIHYKRVSTCGTCQ